MWNWTWYSGFSENDQLDLEKFQDVPDRSILAPEAGKHHEKGMDQSRGIRRREGKEKAIYHPLCCGNKSTAILALSSWAYFLTSALGSTLGSDSAWKINAFLKIDQNLIRPLTRVQTDTCDLKPPFWETLTSRVQSTSCDQQQFYILFYQKTFSISDQVIFNVCAGLVWFVSLLCKRYRMLVFSYLSVSIHHWSLMEPRKKSVGLKCRCLFISIY